MRLDEFSEYTRMQRFKREEVDDLPKLLRMAKGTVQISTVLLEKEHRLESVKSDLSEKQLERLTRLQEIINGTRY